MFWKEETSSKKEKDIIASQIEQLGPGQSLRAGSYGEVYRRSLIRNILAVCVPCHDLPHEK